MDLAGTCVIHPNFGGHHNEAERMNAVETKVHEHDITLARLETLIAQNNHRFDGIDRRFDAMDRRIDSLERRFDSLDRRINWFFCLLFTSWLSTIGLILYKLSE